MAALDSLRPAADAAPPRLGHGFAALVLALLMSLQPVSTDLMLPALPAIAADLRSPMAPVQLTMSALILAFGLAQLVWGPVADRLGRRPVLLTGLALYTLAAVAAGLAASVAGLVAWRALQGAALAAVVVCARAMLRDLYEPHQGALVMARALTGLGLVAVASPLVAGALVALAGWRGALAGMAAAGLALAAFVALRVPETAPPARPGSVRPAALLAQSRRVLAHPRFRAWALLVACSYGGIYVFLASSGFVLIGVLGLGPVAAGAAMCSLSLGYIAGTLRGRGWIARLGPVRAVRRASTITAVAALAFGAVALTDWRSVWAVVLPSLVYAFAHGVHNPCGQAGAVGPFPQAAGLAAALAGVVSSAAAFGIGLWLGGALDGSMRPLALGMALCAAATAVVARSLVQRDGAPPAA